jgi:hypothetical protein
MADKAMLPKDKRGIDESMTRARGVEASSVWTEISSEKRFLTRPGQNSIFGGQISQLI